MDLYSTLMLNQKLKSSCDLCSASKVRCDSGKPACSRCSGLNQSCTYSPARRAGRPHRPRRESEQQHQHKQQKQHEQTQPNALRETSSYACQSIGNFTWSDLSIDDTVSSATRRPGTDFLDFMETCVPGLSINQTQDTNVSTGGDCVKTAASIIEQLDSAEKGPRRSAPCLSTTMTCQMLLTILVCPCSDQPAVALLVASGCLALLDKVYRRCEETMSSSNPVVSPASSCIVSTANGVCRNSYLEPNLFGWAAVSPPARTEFLGGLVDIEHEGIEDLAKIAKLILRYSERYNNERHNSSEGEDSNSAGHIVKPIIMLLRLKLQSATQQAAGRLVL
ncbi:hypothetical protein LX32DRAFT_79376 [Colletotrichum zoysiae]|uniref:Zn(2)-C6 fungal-type domain-containing protein n=1 Tax=Colletotrichum zoysiae TaxID=1216348 RepID=A0AAD9M0F8_9PEZI|nr:hypothetical protein LX32DRAFT_79376 [Colletotrichum zoysiae]